MKNLAKAVIAVMKEVKGIDKSMTVGSGNYSYKGVSDKDVKEIIGEAMARNGLCVLPIGVEPTVHIDRWEEANGNYAPKQKQSVFTEVKCRYLLLHESGESVQLQGAGHGQDAMDKAIGKATTYSLKYTLLYTFLTPTGKIDDADTTHSEEIQAPKTTTKVEPKQAPKTTTKVEPKQAPKKELPTLVKDSKEWKSLEGYIASGKLTDVSKISLYSVSPELSKELEVLISNKTNEGSRLPNLTREQFEQAKTMKPNEILKLLAEHRMSNETREALTKMAKK